MAFALALGANVRRWASRLVQARRGWALTSRVLAALAGGYGFTSLLTLALSLCLPALGVSRVQALHALSMGSFLVYAAVIMAMFHAASPARAWRWLLLASAPLGIIVAAALPRAG
jgi:hypothetical protein